MEALDGSFLPFCVPHLSHRRRGFQEIGAGRERDTLMPDPRTKGHCILAGPVPPRTPKDSMVGVQERLDVGKVVQESTRVTLEVPVVTKSRDSSPATATVPPFCPTPQGKASKGEVEDLPSGQIPQKGLSGALASPPHRSPAPQLLHSGPRDLPGTWVPTYLPSSSERNPGVRPSTLRACGHGAEAFEPPSRPCSCPIVCGTGAGRGPAVESPPPTAPSPS